MISLNTPIPFDLLHDNDPWISIVDFLPKSVIGSCDLIEC